MPPNGVAQINLTANPGALATGLNAAYRMVANFAKLSGSVLQGLNLAPKVPKNGNGLSVARVALATAVGTYTRRGIDMLVDQGKAIFDFNDKLVRFGIAAKKSGVALDYVGHMARQISNETGMDANQVLATGRAYVDLAGAANFTADKMRILAHAGQVSEATGADIAGMMYQLTTSMKVADSQMEDTMGGLINQAKEGAIEAQQMAREFGALMPLYAKFGVVGREGAIQAGAMFQVIRDGYNTADEAGTGIVRIFGGLRANASRFEKAGVKIWNIDKNGVHTARKFSDIFRDINNSKLAKDPELLKKAFGRSEAWRGWEILSANVERLHEMEEAGKKNGVIQQDLATYTESSAGRMKVATEKMKNAVADAFTPERIERFVTAIEDLMDKMGPLAEAIGKIGDGVGAIYNAGKSLRGWLSMDPKMAEVTADQIDQYAAKHNISKRQAAQEIQNTYQELVGFKSQMAKLMPNDRVTHESNLLAIRTRMNAPSGSDLKNAAQSYINESGLTTRQIGLLQKEAVQQQIADDRYNHTAQSVLGSDQSVQAFASMIGLELWNQANASRGLSSQSGAFEQVNREIDRRTNASTDSAKALYDAFNGMTMNINMDGNKVGGSVRNSTDARRR